MTRIGITQRVSVVKEYQERRDCLDQQWAVILSEFDLIPIPLANRMENIPIYLDNLALDGVVLTSGNDLADLENPTNPAPERDKFETAVLDYAIETGLPLLGVCRGLQLINTHFGGTLKPIDGHVNRNHKLEYINTTDNPELRLPREVTVNSYHNYGITTGNVGEHLEVVAQAPDETVEFVRHQSHPIWGCMWHPERDLPMTPLDRQLFSTLFSKT